jgi:hypothetical protein
MIHGAHFLLYSRDADADRQFLQNVLGFLNVDVGDGWLIFRLPPAEIAVHPSGEGFTQAHGDHDMLGAVLYLMCDDLRSTVKDLESRGASTSDVHTERWGIRTTVTLPSGGELGLYQPTHPTAIRRPA